MTELPPLTGYRLFLLTISLSLAVFMTMLDASIANVAIPSICGDLQTSPNNGTWIITTFAIGQAFMLPLTGWLAKRFGEVRLFLLSATLFIVASMLCGLAPDMPSLIFFRLLQGSMAGPMIPLSQSLLLANYPIEKKGIATAIWGMTSIVAPIFGPILGGLITDNYSWPWVFFVNLPVGLFSILLTLMLLRGRETIKTKTVIDGIGLFLLIISVSCLQIVLDTGKDADWFESHVIIALTILAGLSLIGLIFWTTTRENPIIDLSLFTLRNFSICTIALSLGSMVYIGNIVLLPLWLQTQMGYTPTWAGLAVAPIGVLPFIFAPFIGKYIQRIDSRIAISVGMVIFALTFFWQGNSYTEMGFAQIALPRFYEGLGLAFFFIPIFSTMLVGIPSDRLANALGLANFCRAVGRSFGTSISTTLWDRREAVHQSRLVENITDYNPITQETLFRLKSLGLSYLESLQVLYNVLVKEAYMLALNDVFILSGSLFIGILILAWFLKPQTDIVDGSMVNE